ncbi:MAG TPA: DUF1501 domain-containing protein [Bryobacteraceae bacterium]|nr:DUF1501 domain-containing protein [Bryobacteraceae bacterium]
MMDPLLRHLHSTSRRQFFSRSGLALGSAALSSMLAEESPQTAPHFAPKVKRVIYLFMSGAPSQIETFDYKPKLEELRAAELPASVRMGQRLTGMTATQASFPLAPSMFPFKQRGQSGTWVSDLLPHTANVADRICVIKSTHTEQINHDPAVTFFQTGHQIAGRPSIGSWVAYGLGSENKDLPSFVVLISQGSSTSGDQPLADRLWGSGFIPTRYQGVKFRAAADPVLYLTNPEGLSAQGRRRFLDDLAQLNEQHYADFGDPEISTRVAQYEMAYRMQTSVPELTDLSKESEKTLELYGPDVKKPGSYAANCLLARRMAERGVRFIQLFHRGWDQHVNLPENHPKQCKDIDQPSAALVADLAQRGLLDDTLVVWGGEFGRTAYCQGRLTATDYGRDHHPRCFSMWLAGGGVKPGLSYGATDDFSYNITENPVSVHDLHATILHLLGLDHTRLTFKFQGRHYRLTDVHGNVVKDVLS